MTPGVAAARLPDSPVCIAAMDLARRHSPPFLYNHLLRTYAFGEAAGRAQGLHYDSEMLFLGAMLHDLGLVEGFIGQARFEVDGADAAADFLSRQGYPDAGIAVIWDAIALHTTAGIPPRKRPEIALVQLGAGVDVGAVPRGMLQPALVEAILDAYPRLGFKRAMLEIMADVIARKPMTGLANLMADIGRDQVADFRIPSFCDVVREAAFPD